MVWDALVIIPALEHRADGRLVIRKVVGTVDASGRGNALDQDVPHRAEGHIAPLLAGRDSFYLRHIVPAVNAMIRATVWHPCLLIPV